MDDAIIQTESKALALEMLERCLESPVQLNVDVQRKADATYHLRITRCRRTCADGLDLGSDDDD